MTDEEIEKIIVERVENELEPIDIVIIRGLYYEKSYVDAIRNSVYSQYGEVEYGEIEQKKEDESEIKNINISNGIF